MILNFLKPFSKKEFVQKERYQLYEYLKKDGSFDYELYKEIQTTGNKSKIESIWVVEDNIAFLSEYIKRLNINPAFGICHGTRRGKEQEWFRKYLECEVIGTEISDTALQFPNTIQWDFHNIKPEWVNNVDFIYSNSFDHSYDPDKCLNNWMSCLKKGGICILEHTSAHEPSGANELDPFGADFSYMPYLILNWGRGKFYPRELLKAPITKTNVEYINFIVVQNI